MRSSLVIIRDCAALLDGINDLSSLIVGALSPSRAGKALEQSIEALTVEASDAEATEVNFRNRVVTCRIVCEPTLCFNPPPDR